MARLYVTSISGWSLRKLGHVTKGKTKHPGMIECWVMSRHVIVRDMIFIDDRLNYTSYAWFMGIGTSPVAQIVFVICYKVSYREMNNRRLLE